MIRQLTWRNSVLGLSLALALGFGLAGCGVLEPEAGATEPAAAATTVADTIATPTTHHADLGLAQQLSAAFEDVAKEARPSVVSITTERNPQRNWRQQWQQQGEEQQQQQQNPFGNSPFGDFFQHFFGPNGPQFGTPGPEEALGSGFVVSKDGYILTNAHVVEGADSITVRTADEHELKAKLVGSDPQTDLAVLKVEDGDLEPLSLGDSDSLRVGQWVVAAGNPFGLSSSITSGIVSAKGRSNLRIADYEDFIQTDAAINPGNSGGPLLDLEGNVVGINTAIFSRSGGYMGIGFAIPINEAKNVMHSLITEGKVTRGLLGVRIQDLDENLAKSFHYGSHQGVLIGDVDSGSPADEAGLQSGDIITRYDGQPVKDSSELRLRVAGTHPGETVPVEVYRDGKERQFEVKIGELKSDQTASNHPGTSIDQGVGMTVRTLTPDIADQLGIDSKTRGAVVTAVEPFGPASDAGLRRGDVIVEVQGKPIQTADELRSELGKYNLSEGVRVVVLSNGSRRFAVLKTE